MRIVTFLLAVIWLSACTRSETQYVMAPKDAALATPHGYCAAKGYARGTYGYMVCYENHPKTLEKGRSQRLETLAIISNNRSPAAGHGRSYPVE